MTGIIWAEGVSPGAKITWLKLRERHPEGCRWSDVLAVVGSKASTVRHLAELQKGDWIRKSAEGRFALGPGRGQR